MASARRARGRLPRLWANQWGLVTIEGESPGLVGRLAIGLARTRRLTVMDTLKKLFIWSGIAALVLLAILLPVIVVTGMFGGKPLAGTVGLIGLVMLAFGVAWYVRSQVHRG